MKRNIAVLGAGSWGCALTSVLLVNGHHVKLWSIDEAEVKMLNETKEQKDKLPGVILEGDFEATSNMEDAVNGVDIIVSAVPSAFTRSTAKALSQYIKPNQIIVDVAKGIEEETFYTLSQQIEEEIPGVKLAVLSGPSHAEEVGRKMTTAICAASKDPEIAKEIQNLFMNEYFRVYTSSDVIGVEIGGALKNVIALAAGIATGLGLGDNAKAALITRGIREIAKVGVASGGKEETFYGLTGIGDLIVTCDSVHSRNRKAGILIGQGKSMDEAVAEVKMIVEGIYSTKAAVGIANKYNVDVPILTEVSKILFENKDPKQSIMDLMLRDKRDEI